MTRVKCTHKKTKSTKADTRKHAIAIEILGLKAARKAKQERAKKRKEGAKMDREMGKGCVVILSL